MTTELPDELAPFRQTMADVLPALALLQQALLALRGQVTSPTDELELLHLISLTLLTHQRGQLLLGDARIGQRQPEVTHPVDVQHAQELLMTAHNHLLQQLPTFASFVVLQFVSEIGAILQAVSRRVPSH